MNYEKAQVISAFLCRGSYPGRWLLFLSKWADKIVLYESTMSTYSNSFDEQGKPSLLLKRLV